MSKEDSVRNVYKGKIYDKIRYGLPLRWCMLGGQGFINSNELNELKEGGGARCLISLFEGLCEETIDNHFWVLSFCNYALAIRVSSLTLSPGNA